VSKRTRNQRDGPAVGPFAYNVYASFADYGNNAGYWLASGDGQVRSFGGAPVLGGVPATADDPVVAIVATADHQGYYLLRSSGAVNDFGDAIFRGNGSDRLGLTRSFVAMAVVADGPAGGYYLLTDDGQVVGFGVAAPSLGNAAVGIAAEPSAGGAGYWVVDNAGAVTGFGTAQPTGGLAPPAAGAAVAVLPGWWHSAATSERVHSSPTPPAGLSSCIREARINPNCLYLYATEYPD
jgi:hypothetical protein